MKSNKKNKNILMSHIKGIIPSCIILLFISIFISLLNLLNPYLKKIIVNVGIGEQNKKILTYYIIFSIIVLLAINFLNFFNETLFNIASTKFIKTVKKDLFSRLTRMPLSILNTKQNGYIQARINEINSLSNLFSPIVFRILISLFSMIGAMIYLIKLDISIFFISIVTLPIIFFINNCALRKVSALSEGIYESEANLSGKLQENISGASEIKQLNREKIISDNINKDVDYIAKKEIKRGISFVGVTTQITIICSLVQLLITYIVGIKIMKIELTLGDYVSIIDYVSLIFSPIILLSNYNLTIKPSLVGLKRINHFFNVELENENETGIEIKEIKKIDFKNVTFAYENKINVLENINFRVNSKDKILIKGSNGTGKTTIVKLLLGLILTSSGYICYNDTRLTSYQLSSIRNKIGLLSQDSYIFTGTIMDNIVYNKEDMEKWSEISTNKIFEGVNWNDGLVLENGKNLSNGQKQKIALARMLIRNPDVIIMDEGITNLDMQSQKIFKDAINTIFSEKICIIVTHSNVLDDCVSRKLRIENRMIVEDN